MFAVPNRDRSGRRTIIYRPGVFNMKSFLNEDMLKMHALVYETVMENEEDQIRGLVHIIDAENLTFAHLTLFTPKEAVRIVKNTEVCNVYFELFCWNSFN